MTMRNIFYHVAPAVITEVLENKPLDTDAVSGRDIQL